MKVPINKKTRYNKTNTLTKTTFEIEGCPQAMLNWFKEKQVKPSAAEEKTDGFHTANK